MCNTEDGPVVYTLKKADCQGPSPWLSWLSSKHLLALLKTLFMSHRRPLPKYYINQGMDGIQEMSLRKKIVATCVINVLSSYCRRSFVTTLSKTLSGL